MRTHADAPRSRDTLDTILSGIRGLGIRRRGDDRWIGGVCSGVADRYGVDPVVVRVATFLLFLLGGIGVSAYLVAWVLLPDSTDRIAAERAVRDGDGASIVLLVAAALSLFSGFPWWFGDRHFVPLGLIVPAVILWVFVGRRHGWRGGPCSPGTRAPRGAEGAAAGSSAARLSTDWSPQDAPSAHSGGSSAAYAAAASPPSAAVLGPPAYVPSVRRRSGGMLMTLVGVGAGLVAYGATLWTADRLDWAGQHSVIAMAAGLAVVGLLLLAIGIRGWRAGFLGLLTILGMVLTLASSSFTSAGFSQGLFSGRTGQLTWKPATLTSRTTLGLSAGQARLDLGGLSAGTVSGQMLPVSVGAGQLTVMVPPGLAVKVDAHVGMGQILAPGEGGDEGRDHQGQGGIGVWRAITVGSAVDPLVVKADVGVGQISVVTR